MGPVVYSCEATAEGCSDTECPYCYGGLRELPERLVTLAHNLAIAAGLCAAFEMGRDAGPGKYVPFVTCWWRPGCGKSWVWPHMTREDGRPTP